MNILQNYRKIIKTKIDIDEFIEANTSQKGFNAKELFKDFMTLAPGDKLGYCEIVTLRKGGMGKSTRLATNARAVTSTSHYARSNSRNASGGRPALSRRSIIPRSATSTTSAWHARVPTPHLLRRL